MNKTKAKITTNQIPENQITVDIDTLASMLLCGHATARKIANEANATLRINRRVLFDVEKVKNYVNDMSM